MQFKKILTILLLFLSCCLASCVSASESVPFDQSWDISQKNNELEQTFSITTFNVYHLSIGFGPINVKDYALHRSEQFGQLREFVGGGDGRFYNIKTHEYVPHASTDKGALQLQHLFATGEVIVKYSEPGTIIPVHFKIEKMDNGEITKIVMEREVDTAGMGGAIPHGGWSREIAFVKLRPGNYKISISAGKGVELPPNIETYLELYSEANTIPPKDDEQE